ncbi:hypothetical protein KUCAC02_018960 [Chaenocephalus aceratus]|uniref:Uncharacterized protein n=1 Tax=Chaenocephalus aceratus TaxID=36190 RepID=A0ACB9WAX5_CHAAC|nr:hypothetical protein KUCAC02_018960 [Chaenocephalus aceratus]
MRETASCTTEKCKWLMPSHVKKIPAAPVAMIDFSSAKSKKQKLDDAIAGQTASGLISSPDFMEMTNEWACLGYGLASCKA